MATIGFIGLGNMGLPMTRNLLKAGHRVRGFDIVPASVERAAAAGVEPAESIAEACAGADIVITMLPAGAQVREVYLGTPGVLAAAAPGTLLIDCSTIDVETARAVAERAVAAVEKLRADIGIPTRLRDLGVTEDQFRPFADKAFGIKRILRVNPRAVTADDLESILRAAF